MVQDTGFEALPNCAGPAGRGKVAQILSAARRVFLERGFGSATTDMIQREAGVSKSTMYAHFPTKDELFAAVVQSECEAFMQQLLAQPSDELGLREMLARVGIQFLDLILDPSRLALYRIVLSEAPRFPQLGQSFYASGPKRLQDRLTQVLREAQARGELRAAQLDVAAAQFLELLRGDMHLRCLLGLETKPDEVLIRRLVDQVVETFLRAYGPAN